jgi:PAT family beta-lactamase induction signal transducer AmpG
LSDPQPPPRKTPPLWLMGFANSTIGVSGGILLLTIPQLLAGDHVPEARIAQITAFALVPGFTSFLVAPILDVKFSRRAYAFALAILCGLFCFVALMSRYNLPAIGWLLFAAIFASQLNTAAVAGWLSSIMPKDQESRLSAWFNVGNVAAFGLTAIVGIGLLRIQPYWLGAGLLSLFCVAPALIFPFMPAPGPDRRLAGESFGQFARDLAALVRKPQVLLTLFFFAVPAASFALTNTLGGLGADFHAPEGFVALVGGIGVTLSGIAGSLMIPPLAKLVRARTLYLLVGVAGALFTLALIVAPRSPTGFLVAMIGENIAQSGAFTAANLVMFRALGKDNPFAATQFALMLAAQLFPLVYMQALDGKAYDHGGLRLMYLNDAGLGLAACVLLAFVLSVAARLARRWPSLAAD